MVKCRFLYPMQEVMPFLRVRLEVGQDGKNGKPIPGYPDENGLLELSLPLVSGK